MFREKSQKFFNGCKMAEMNKQIECKKLDIDRANNINSSVWDQWKTTRQLKNQQWSQNAYWTFSLCFEKVERRADQIWRVSSLYQFNFV